MSPILVTLLAAVPFFVGTYLLAEWLIARGWGSRDDDPNPSS